MKHPRIEVVCSIQSFSINLQCVEENSLDRLRVEEGLLVEEVKTWCFQGRGHRFYPGQGTNIPHGKWCGQKIKKRYKEKLGIDKHKITPVNLLLSSL